MQRAKIGPNSLKAKQLLQRKGKFFSFVGFGSSTATVEKEKF